MGVSRIPLIVVIPEKEFLIFLTPPPTPRENDLYTLIDSLYVFTVSPYADRNPCKMYFRPVIADAICRASVPDFLGLVQEAPNWAVKDRTQHTWGG